MRLLDVSISLAGLVVLSPLLLIVAVVVKCSSPGPVLYCAPRVGKDGRVFKLYKFRSMVVDAADRGPRVTGRDDPRLTAVGRVLRRTKLDELPQLFNTLAGDMSLVGPRPEDPLYVKSYSAAQLQVLRVKPGITSAATILSPARRANADRPRLGEHLRDGDPAGQAPDRAGLSLRSHALDRCADPGADGVCLVHETDASRQREPRFTMQELIRRDPSAAPVVYEPRSQDIWIDQYLDEKETEVSRYVHIILRRKRLVASVTLLVLAAAAAWSFTTERRYTSSVKLQIDPEQSVLPYRELNDAIMADPRYIGTQTQVLKSEALARRVVLALDPAIGPDAVTGAAKWFAANLLVTPVEGTQVVTVSYGSSDPVYAAKAINTLADEYVNYGFQTKRDSSTTARDFLEKELAKLRLKLEQSERQLVAYAREHSILLSAEGNNVITAEAGRPEPRADESRSGGPVEPVSDAAGHDTRELPREAPDELS